MVDGKIQKSGDKTLAKELEDEGYKQFSEKTADTLNILN